MSTAACYAGGVVGEFVATVAIKTCHAGMLAEVAVGAEIGHFAASVYENGL